MWGFQLLNPDGSIQFDVSNRVIRMLAVSDASGNGSAVVPALSEGTPIVAVAVSDESKVAPSVTVSGTTVSWSYGSTPVSDWDTASEIMVSAY